MTGSEPLKGCFLPAIAIHSELECSARVVTSAAIIAEIRSTHSRATNTSAANTRRRYPPPTQHDLPSFGNRREIPRTTAAATHRNAVASRDAFT